MSCLSGRSIGSASPVQLNRSRLEFPVCLLVLIAFVSVVVQASLVVAAEPAAEPQAKAAAMVEEYVKSSKAAVGVSAIDLRRGETLIALKDQELYQPASNQKLLTSAVALARLGADFKFTTAVYLLGKDLTVRGDGDPSLGDPLLAAEQKKTIYDALDAWAAAVKDKAAAAFQGDLLLCGGAGAGKYRNGDWPQDQYRRWYVAPVAPLNFNDNCLDVSLRIDKGVIAAQVEPQTRYIKVVNGIKLGQKNLWSVQINKDNSVVTLVGTAVKATAEPLSVAVDNPPLLLGRVLADRLERAGVPVKGAIRVVEADALDWSKAASIARTETPLAVVMARANKRSLNMMAEGMLLRAGDGTWEGSAKLATETLTRDYGLPAEAFVLRDGSGLSRRDRVSPAAMSLLLAKLLQRKDAAVFLASLPISGTDGTMADRLDEPAYRGRVLGKTGYIAGVSSLSGYVLDKGGKCVIAYSILANHVAEGFKAKQLQEKLCQMLVTWLDGADEPKTTAGSK